MFTLSGLLHDNFTGSDTHTWSIPLFYRIRHIYFILAALCVEFHRIRHILFYRIRLEIILPEPLHEYPFLSVTWWHCSSVTWLLCRISSVVTLPGLWISCVMDLLICYTTGSAWLLFCPPDSVIPRLIQNTITKEFIYLI